MTVSSAEVLLDPTRAARIAASRARPAGTRTAKLRHIVSNLGVALLFFGELIPLVRGEFFGGPPVELTWANLIWIGGSMLMAMLSLVRAPAASSMINFRSVMATTSMMAAPVAMRPDMRSVGLLAALAVAIEFFGILLSQISRLYLGRKFGLLPANRGIVKSGPFRFVRHPIYAGWLILIAGYVMAYPSLLNAMMVAATLPLMMWRIRLEEDLLITDPMYCEYCHSTPYRLIPGLF